ncbi:tetratricopeptide repeat protein [Methylobrevis pamukkalensis]|uniref:Putative beta-lactamase HcpD n=1 Tax=Methylobrevis pamukkalensis TaxID=1439726 RepID=A0A1E3H1Q0_9HYPH|nr:tetratricopeptide repeat protein [Methylobrevis pamukkalensis]ODN70240.1 putative beta-lactamase HcpD precursor [Methylobrevis pamukkalensis]
MADTTGSECDRLAASRNDPAFASTGVDHLDIDPTAARAVCAKALAGNPGEPRFAFQLGRAEQRLGNHQRARELYEAAGAKGYRLADVNLAILHEDGLGVPIDTRRARSLYERAAAAGIGVALNNIGSMYEDGRGQPVDRDIALAYYRRAADAGYAPAMGNIAWMLEHAPEGVKDTRAVAVAYAEAARLDVTFAQIRLGLFYRDGIFVAAPDPHAALAHFERAAQSGDLWGRLHAAQILLADVRSIASDPDEGMVKLDRVLAEADDSLLAEALSTKAEYILAREGLPGKAMQLLQRAVDVAPEEASVWAARAAVLAAQDDLDGADAALAEAITRNDQFAPWLVRRAEIREKLGDAVMAADLRRRAGNAAWGGFFLGNAD